MRLKLAVVVLSIGIVYLAYHIQDRIPPGFKQEWKVRLYLSAWKLAFLCSSTFVKLGFEEVATMKSTAKVIADLHHLLETPDTDVIRNQLTFDGVKVFIYEPVNKADNRRAIMFYHGGGFVVGEPNFFHHQMHRMSKYLDAVIVFPDYRLAPGHPFPAAFDDCMTAYKHFVQNVEKFGVDPTRIAVMGDSAGGNLAAVIALNLKISKYKQMPKLQVLQFPLLQAENLDTPSYRANANGPFLSTGSMAFFYSAYFFGKDYEKYTSDFLNQLHTTTEVKINNADNELNINHLPDDDDFKKGYQPIFKEGNKELWIKIKEKVRDPRFSPIFVKKENLIGLPKTYITTCQYDVLRDDAYYYAAQLRTANVHVDHVNLHVCFHGWPLLNAYVENLDAEFDKMLKYIDENL